MGHARRAHVAAEAIARTVDILLVAADDDDLVCTLTVRLGADHDHAARR